MDRVGVRVRIYWQGGLIDSRFVTSPRVRLGAVAGPGVDFVVPIVELDDPIVVAEIAPTGVTAWVPELGGARRGGARRLDVGVPVRFSIADFDVELEAEAARRLPRFDRIALNATAARVLMLSVAAHVLLAVGAALMPKPVGIVEAKMREVAKRRAIDVVAEAKFVAFDVRERSDIDDPLAAANSSMQHDPNLEPGDRPNEHLKVVIDRARKDVAACFADAREDGRVVMRFTIDEAGAVYSARALDAEALDAGEVDCVTAVVKSMRFSPSARWSAVTYPWTVRRVH